MRRRPLPSAEEALRILETKRSRPPSRPPPAAGRNLAAVVRQLDERFGQGAEGLKARWTEIVGEILARRTEPNRLVKPRGGGPASLEIRVEGPSAALIQHQSSDIIARVNLLLGAGAVDKLRIVQGPLRGARRPEPPALAVRRRSKAPLDAAAERQLAESLADIAEGPVKQALARLGREVMRREGK
ncbi:MAG TPA: DciA family protein [Caulobacteraceae bacterium]|nr:DciA family protein [Caulobacteraceae bacterium]